MYYYSESRKKTSTKQKLKYCADDDEKNEKVLEASPYFYLFRQTTKKIVL